MRLYKFYIHGEISAVSRSAAIKKLYELTKEIRDAEYSNPISRRKKELSNLKIEIE